MRPALSVLQLDTAFPRLPGDVAAPETYRAPIEIIRIPGADVSAIVRADPAQIDIAPFEAALLRARGEIITTSCGFLSFWQDHLQARSDRPIVTSALAGLPRLGQVFAPEALLILTFDASALGLDHLCGQEAFAASIAGLSSQTHMRQAIERDGHLDLTQATADLLSLIHVASDDKTQAIVLECTNFPPMIPAIRERFGLKVFSILSELERLRPGLVRPEFL